MLKQIVYVGLVSMALTQLGAGQTDNDPQDDSNFSVQTGMLNYLGSFYEQYTPPYGIIAGKAALYRMARTGTTRVSVSFGVGLSLEPDGPTLSDLAATDFVFKVHSRPCTENGGPTYQHPYLCGISGCTDAQVAAAKSSSLPLELEFTSKVDTTQFNGGSVEVTWPLHIPDYYYGQDRSTLSIVMYSPSHAGVPMVCADLENDRQMDGLVYYVNEDATSNVPSVSNAALIRDERGFSQLDIRVANLRPGHIYPAYIHSLPCVPLSGQSSARGGERYMYDINCYGMIGTSGCEATSTNQIHLRLEVDSQTAAAELSTRINGLLRADAQSILLMDCIDNNGNTDPSGTCNGGEPVLVCIDMVNEIPQMASSSSTVNPGVVTPENKLTASPVSSSPSVAPSQNQDSPDGGDSPENRDDETTTTIAMVNPATNPTTPPPSAWVGNNPCPKVRYVSRGKGKKGKSNEKLEFVDPLIINQGSCCLDINGPPASLLSFGMSELGGRTVSGIAASAIIVGVAGTVLLLSAAAMFAFRRRTERKYQEMANSYAVPTTTDNEAYTTPPHKREPFADYAIPTAK